MCSYNIQRLKSFFETSFSSQTVMHKVFYIGTQSRVKIEQEPFSSRIWNLELDNFAHVNGEWGTCEISIYLIQMAMFHPFQIEIGQFFVLFWSFGLSDVYFPTKQVSLRNFLWWKRYEQKTHQKKKRYEQKIINSSSFSRSKLLSLSSFRVMEFIFWSFGIQWVLAEKVLDLLVGWWN